MDFFRRLLKLKCSIAIYNIWQSRKEKKLLGITGNLNTMLVWGFFHLIVFINPFSNWFCISRSWSKVYQKGLWKIQDWWKFCLETKSLLSDYLVMKHNTCEIRKMYIHFVFLLLILKKANNIFQHPTVLTESDLCTLYYKKDTKFKVPKGLLFTGLCR